MAASIALATRRIASEVPRRAEPGGSSRRSRVLPCVRAPSRARQMGSQCAKETDCAGEQGYKHNDDSDCSRAGKFRRRLAWADGGREQPTKCGVCKARGSSGQNADSYAATSPCSEVSSAEVNQIRTECGGGIRKAEDARSRRRDDVEDENRDR